MATHNEEKNIKDCLDSIKMLADEIIIVDGESTDKTVEIAKKMGAIVKITSNKLNFHLNKKIALEMAKGDLILQLDADERVDKQLASFINKIHQQVVTNDKSCTDVAWQIKRKNFFMGRWLKKGGQYPDPVIRLFIKGYAKLPAKDVHEQMQVKGSIGVAEGHLEHFTYPHFKDYLRKFNHYTSLKATQLKADHVKINLFNSVNYLFFKPLFTFFKIFIRHKGFVDTWPGFIFALFSGFYHSLSYLKLWELSLND